MFRSLQIFSCQIYTDLPKLQVRVKPQDVFME